MQFLQLQILDREFVNVQHVQGVAMAPLSDVDEQKTSHSGGVVGTQTESGLNDCQGGAGVSAEEQHNGLVHVLRGTGHSCSMCQKGWSQKATRRDSTIDQCFVAAIPIEARLQDLVGFVLLAQHTQRLHQIAAIQVLGLIILGRCGHSRESPLQAPPDIQGSHRIPQLQMKEAESQQYVVDQMPGGIHIWFLGRN